MHVGVENVSTSKSDRAAYGVDYFWIGRSMWVDRGEKPPMPDWIVRPGSSVEVSKILKIARTALKSRSISGAADRDRRVAHCPWRAES